MGHQFYTGDKAVSQLNNIAQYNGKTISLKVSDPESIISALSSPTFANTKFDNGKAQEMMIKTMEESIKGFQEGFKGMSGKGVAYSEQALTNNISTDTTQKG